MIEIILDFISFIFEFFGTKHGFFRNLVEPIIPKPVKVYDVNIKTIENGYFNFTLKGLLKKLWYNTKPLFITEVPKSYLTPDIYNKTMKQFNKQTFEKDMFWLDTIFNKEMKTLDNFVDSNPSYLNNKKKYDLLSKQSTEMHDLYNKQIANLKLNDRMYGVIYKKKL